MHEDDRKKRGEGIPNPDGKSFAPDDRENIMAIRGLVSTDTGAYAVLDLIENVHVARQLKSARQANSHTKWDRILIENMIDRQLFEVANLIEEQKK